MHPNPIATIIALWIVSGAALGATLELVGEPGSLGAVGLPGEDGGDGENGGAVQVMIDAPEATNIGTAEGGVGGAGGVGGPAAGPGLPPGAGGTGGAGGAAIAIVTASGGATSRVTAGATAIGGTGGSGGTAGEPANGGAPALDGHGGAGGSATATASGLNGNQDGGIVAAFAHGGDGGAGAVRGPGGNAFLHDAVSGSAPALMFFWQEAIGGDGGLTGGDAVSEVTTENTGGGHLTLFSHAVGGNATHVSEEVVETCGGDVRVSAVATDHRGGRILVAGRAEAGSGGSSSFARHGRVSLGRIYGQSTAGGSVRVSVYVAADGYELINAVDGDTTGDLYLAQIAESSLARGAPASGSAVSVLQKSSDARSIELFTRALGGSVSQPFDGSAGHGNAVSEAEGSGAGVRASAEAIGGDGRPAPPGWPPPPPVDDDGQPPVIDPPPPVRGGNGEARARAHSTGDAIETTAFARAEGGRHGGDAYSESSAVADGPGPVSARSEAIIPDGRGFAESSSLAIGAGPERVSSSADAASRECVTFFCGSVYASAESRGVREATAYAIASGRVVGGADARTSSHDFVRGARASSTLQDHHEGNGRDTTRKSWSAIHAGWEGYSTEPRSAEQIAVALGHPHAADIDAWLSDNSPAAVAASDAGDVFALGKLGTSTDTLDFSGEVEFSLDRSALVGQDDIFLAFLAPDAIAGGFETLDLSVAIDGVEILDLQWSDLASADEFFGETVLELPVGDSVVDPLLDVLISMRIVLGGVEQEFLADFALFSAEPVPEPALPALVLAALFALVLQRRARASILRR